MCAGYLRVAAGGAGRRGARQAGGHPHHQPPQLPQLLHATGVRAALNFTLLL